MPSFPYEYKVVVWDIQTGVVVKDFMVDALVPNKITFCGNQTTVVASNYKTLHMYDILKGVQLSKVLLPSHARNVRTHWGHGDSLLFATSFEIDGKIMIDIRDPQPASSPPFPVTESFLLQPHEGYFSFSPVSFHASFFATREAVILNVRDLEILLRIDGTTAPNHKESQCFSPDGRFFAYVTRADEICVWKNTSTGYIPWSTFMHQFPGLQGFAFSPSAISILSWGGGGIGLLDNHLRPPSPQKNRHPQNTWHSITAGTHLVAYSADGTRIATARPHQHLVKILDPLLDTTQRYIHTFMGIRDIKIFDNVLFVADGNRLASWDLGVGGTGRDAHGVWRATLGGNLGTGWFKLSNNCSQIVMVTERTVFLYDIKTQKTLNECTIRHLTRDFFDKPTMDNIWDFRFSPDGRQLWFLLGETPVRASDPSHCATLHTTKDWRSAEVTWEFLEDIWSQDSCFPPPGYRIRLGSGWVEGPGDKKLLWLPPSWRTESMIEAMWNGNFLALVSYCHPEPIIIEFRPRPPPHSRSAHSSNP